MIVFNLSLIIHAVRHKSLAINQCYVDISRELGIVKILCFFFSDMICKVMIYKIMNRDRGLGI